MSLIYAADILIANMPSGVAYGERWRSIVDMLRTSDVEIPLLGSEERNEFVDLMENYCLGRYRCPLSMGKYGNHYDHQYDEYNRKVDVAVEFWSQIC